MISVPNVVMQELLLNYFKQSIMYSSEMAKSAVYIIRDYFSSLDEKSQRTIVFELEGAIERSSRYGQTLGSKEDHELWIELLSICKSKLGIDSKP
jgi:hypothetical protein